MAEIFISYARADRAKIEMLAAALKADGYSVWWDRDIHGGAQFASEIGRQLAEAETVVVAWSETSMVSEWVLDEAAQARDDGKLIPIALDNTIPPLGFRQRQAIDFTKWKGASGEDAFIDLKNSVARVKDGETIVEPVQLPASSSRIGPSPLLIGAIAAGIAFIALIGFYTLRSGEQASNDVPKLAKQYERSAIAFTPIEVYDESPEAAQFARGLKNEFKRTLATNLLTVIETNDATEDSPRAEFLVETSVDRNENNFAVDVDVTHTPSGTKAWSFKAERSVEEANQFRKQNAILITRIFQCAMNDYRARMDGTDDPKIINVVMRLCEAIRTEGPHWRQLPTISKELLELAPNSGLAHATYANNLAFSTRWGRAPEELAELQIEIREHASIALDLKPGVGEAYFALSTLVDGDLSLIERERLLRQGLERDPEAYFLRGGLGNLLASVGRVQEARSHLRQDVDRDPLNSLRSIHLAQTAAATGDTWRANQLLRDTVEQFPEARRAVWN
ncbi:MAG: toll/interleukin-1 receptor domain-containing protein, partial [Marinicaulis sp.]|nr:toll/interleukin-1 receptor domain-containing protein [Marinicaulis sp.]